MRVVTVLVFATILYTVHSSKRYHVMKLHKENFYGAYVDCMSRGLQLATIDSKDEQTAIEAAVARSGNAVPFWISGTDLVEEGTFLWLSTGKPITFSNWNSPEPNNAEGKEDCVIIHNKDGNFIWNDLNCETKMHYICEEKTNADNVHLQINF